MLPGEVRVFSDRTYWPLIKIGVFGQARCAESDGIVLCSSGTGSVAGTNFPQPGAESVTPLAAGVASDISPYLGFGWKRDAAGVIWSEGPRMSLHLRPEAGTSQTLRITLDAIAFTEGGTRDVAISLNGTTLLEKSLPDAAATIVEIRLPQASLIQGVAWLAFDVTRPVDPARRNLQAPVNRAALRLRQIELVPTAPIL